MTEPTDADARQDDDDTDAKHLTVFQRPLPREAVLALTGLLLVLGAIFAGKVVFTDDGTAEPVAEEEAAYRSALQDTTTTTAAPPTTAAPTTTAPAPAPAPTAAPTTTVATAPPTTAAPAVTADSGGAVPDPYSYATWDRLAVCESTSNWAINTGNGYYGGIQFSLSSWRAVGGTGYPHEASRETQITMAIRLWEIQGWVAWPACTAELGWR